MFWFGFFIQKSLLQYQSPTLNLQQNWLGLFILFYVIYTSGHVNENCHFFMIFLLREKLLFLAFLLLEYLRRFCPKIKIQQTLVFCLHLYNMKSWKQTLLKLETLGTCRSMILIKQWQKVCCCEDWVDINSISSVAQGVNR